MPHLGDYSTGSTVFFMFTTVNSTGAPTAFSSGGLTAYAGASTVQNTTGITLTSTFDGVVGLNHVQVDMVGTSTFYLPGVQPSIVVSSGAGSEDMSGYVLASWSIARGVPTDWNAIFNSTVAKVLSGTSFSAQIQANSSLESFSFLMVSTDHVTPKTGLVGIVGTRSIDGGAFASLGNSTLSTEISNGMYAIDLTAADLNGQTVTLRFATTETGADDTMIGIVTQPNT